jgi:hypothetical protein
MGEATREAPAQAELRPTSAGARRAVLPYDATPPGILIDWSNRFCRG